MDHKRYMRRCFDLAYQGAGKVAPNPLVGAVLVHQGRIIGEGFHTAYGQPHAEVEAVRSVREEDRHLLSASTLYVSLEPCCFHGKTPACTHLILEKKIPEVVISTLDFTPEVAGKGVAILREAGIKVLTGVLEEEGKRVAAIRNHIVRHHRPFVLLKYARSADGFLSKKGQPTWLTNSFSKRLVHQWRKETDAILVGTETALIDNPRLTTRYFKGASPLRIVLDRRGRLPHDIHLFDDSAPTWVCTEHEDYYTPLKKKIQVQVMDFDAPDFLEQLLHQLYRSGIASLMVEGGAALLQSFITSDLWEEARVFQSDRPLEEGLLAPRLEMPPTEEFNLLNDKLYVFRNHVHTR
jgi:diaminohydroxyphosphoribosylaminopyrimidine deaminase/5-amino-6-(5-phosphoribosylamino)uracil reductase